jgi:hypothetical protein
MFSAALQCRAMPHPFAFRLRFAMVHLDIVAPINSR